MELVQTLPVGGGGGGVLIHGDSIKRKLADWGEEKIALTHACLIASPFFLPESAKKQSPAGPWIIYVFFWLPVLVLARKWLPPPSPSWGDRGPEAPDGGEGHGMHTTQPPPTYPARHRGREG